MQSEIVTPKNKAKILSELPIILTVIWFIFLILWYIDLPVESLSSLFHLLAGLSLFIGCSCLFIKLCGVIKKRMPCECNTLFIISIILLTFVIIATVLILLTSNGNGIDGLLLLFIWIPLYIGLFLLILWFSINFFKKDTKINMFFQRHKICRILIKITLICLVLFILNSII